MSVLCYPWEEQAGVEASGTKRKSLNTRADAQGEHEYFSAIILECQGKPPLVTWEWQSHVQGESEAGLADVSVVG